MSSGSYTMEALRMCINYIPTTKSVLVEYFGVDDSGYDRKEEVWQAYQAPILIQ